MRKRLLILCLGLLCCIMFAACGNRKDKNGSRKADDGRSYGGVIKAETGDMVKTAFFNVTVKKAIKYDTYQFDDGLYEAETGKTYLVVQVEIENTYEEDIPMSITDFTLDFEGNKSKDVITGYGKADLNKKKFMENIFTLKMGEKVTKSILFIVDDKEEYTLNYSEYYEDDFKGDSFKIKLTPKLKTASTQETSTGQEENQTEQSEEQITQEEKNTQGEEQTTQAPAE